MLQCELYLSYPHCFGTDLRDLRRFGTMFSLSKVCKLFPCSSKSSLNFRLSSIKFLINWFSYKATCSSESSLNFRLSSTRLLINWFPM